MVLQKQTQKITAEDYAETWENHVNALGRLGWNLELPENKRLREIQEELKTLVAEAVKKYEKKLNSGYYDQ